MGSILDDEALSRPTALLIASVTVMMVDCAVCGLELDLLEVRDAAA